MIYEKSYTRLTLALDIIEKIESGAFKGFHELGIIKHQIQLHDIIGIKPSKEMKITCSDKSVPLDESNICWKAADIIKDHFNIRNNIHIDIEKRIPVKGGLAGGSTNAATVMMLLCSLWDLELSKKDLAELGRGAGMDVPFYFYGKSAFDTESTGVFREIDTNLEFTFILAIPPFGVSTAEAYGNIDYSLIGKKVTESFNVEKALAANDKATLLDNMHNDFEISVFKKFPELLNIKEEMLKAGCSAAVMSGSGSTMIGVVENGDQVETIASQIGVETLITKSL